MRSLVLLALLSCAHAPPGAVPPSVAVYTAHPDDESMYAGGTLVALGRRGIPVSVVIASHGEGGRLLERAASGDYRENREHARAHVAQVRDREMSEAARRGHFTVAYLYPASANVDYAWTTSAEETRATWDRTLPGGERELLRRLAADIRQRRPRVVLTLDTRDDPHPSHHGHHRAIGALVERAAQLATDPDFQAPGAPHAVEEVLAFTPAGTRPDVQLAVRPEDRRALLEAHPSQFTPADLQSPLATRTREDFTLRWRAPGRTHSALQELLAP